MEGQEDQLLTESQVRSTMRWPLPASIIETNPTFQFEVHENKNTFFPTGSGLIGDPTNRYIQVLISGIRTSELIWKKETLSIQLS